MNIPIFKVYGDNDDNIESKIRGNLSLRSWNILEEREKKNIILSFEKEDWIDQYSSILLTIGNYFNNNYMSLNPFRDLNKIIPEKDYTSIGYSNEYDMKKAAFGDFKTILLSATEEIVYKVISKFAEAQIDSYKYSHLTENSTKEEIGEAFKKFDRFCNFFNHISEQYSLKVKLTREGLIPKQDDKITEEIYKPTIDLLQNPKWKDVSIELSKVFNNFQDKNYSLVISGCHNVIHRFLAVFLGIDNSNGKGSFGKLFSEFMKNEKLKNQYTINILSGTQGFLSSERAEKSEAKPKKKDVNMNDALLVMNATMVFINFCLNSEID